MCRPLVVSILGTAALFAATAASPTEEKSLHPRLIELIREQRYETPVPKSTLAAVCPSVTEFWEADDVAVSRVYEGPPLKPGVRLIIVGPATGNTAPYAVLMQVGTTVEFLNCSSTDFVEGREAAEDAEESTWYRIAAEIDEPGVEGMCQRPAEEVARFYAFLVDTHIYGEPQSILLTQKELAGEGRSWLTEESRRVLKPYALEVDWRPYEFLPKGECVLSFRTWNPLWRGIREWVAKFPAYDLGHFASVSLGGEGDVLYRIRPGLTISSVGVAPPNPETRK